MHHELTAVQCIASFTFKLDDELDYIRAHTSSFPGIVVASFYYGYWVLQIPGAWIAMRIGGTKVFGYGVFLSALLSILTPVATRYSVYALIVVRILQGLALVI